MAAAQPLKRLTLSLSVTKGEKGCVITLISSIATWNIHRSFCELKELHTKLSTVKECRGIFLPPLPNVLTATSCEYQEYLSKFLCRIYWVQLNEILTFIQAPLQFRRVVTIRHQNEKTMVIKCGKLKKEGFKNKSYSKRYFVVLCSQIIQYWDNKQSFENYKNNKNNKSYFPKGHIDLLLVHSIITQNINKKYSFHLKTKNRIWKIQCSSEQEKNEWVQFLNHYLSSKHYIPFIAPHRPHKIEPIAMDEDIKELFLSKNAKQCTMNEMCDAINRITYILLYHYQLMKAMDYKQEDDARLVINNNDDDDDDDEKGDIRSNDVLYNYINQQLYPYTTFKILNDWFHVVIHHKDEFNTLYDKITNEIGSFCDITMCSSFQRIEIDGIASQCDDSYLDNFKKHRSFKELDIFKICDIIHCYFLHSFDCGMKLNKENLIEIENMMIEHKEDDIHNMTESEIKFGIIKQQLIEKKKELQKYLTFVNCHYGDNVKNKYVTMCNSDDIETKDIIHSFGYKYYYWEYYKNNHEMDLKYNIGFKINDFYIKPKHKDIKTEVIGKIDGKKWDYLIRTALSYLRCDVIKKIESNDMFIIDHFDLNINAGNIISVSHILSILLYTNNIILQRDLISTYIKNTENESLESLKNRHCRYGNWAKYLFETVHCYGNELILKDNKQFYHGIDNILYFTNCVINFNHLISASGSLIVTTSYSISSNINNKNNNDGMILKLIKSDLYNNLNDNIFKLRYFDCSIFSSFAFEDEYLFNGSWNGLQIDSIYHISINRKYRAHLRSLRILDLMFKGFWMKTSLPPTSKKILTILFTNELKNWLGINDNTIILKENIFKLPEYVELSFHCFLHKIESLTIDIASFMKQKHKFNDTNYFGFSWLRRFVISQKIYFINLSLINSLFPHIKTLQILNSVSIGAYSLKFELNDQIFNTFLKLFKSSQFKHATQLKQIQISGFHTSSSRITKLVEKYQQLFKKQKWHLQCIQIQETDQILLVMQCIRNTV